MIIKTHLLIADKIHSYITKCYGDILKKSHFSYGSIRPDISRRNHPVRHTLKDSLLFVEKQAEIIKAHPQNTKSHSMRIGVINHYLSDFFCSKHYYDYSYGIKGLLSHIKYERNLHKTLKSLDIKQLLDTVRIKSASYINASFRDLISMLEKEYAQNSPSIENDIVFAIKAPLIALCFMLGKTADEAFMECAA